MISIYNLEQFILFLLVKHNQLDLRELKLKILKTEPLSEKLFKYQLALLEEDGYIELVEEQSAEFKRCLEKSIDRRIKDIKTYCKKRYPSVIKIKPTDSGRIKYLHNCFCLSYCYSKSAETALVNMKLCEDLADIKTKPPEKCLC